MSRKLNLVGDVYGRLRVLESAGSKAGFTLWLCECECGSRTVTRGNGLRTGVTKSCGCLSKERIGNLRRTHGRTKTRTYRIWKAMRTRCTNTKQLSAKNYVLRGISCCDRWKEFTNFLEDMGEAPEGLTLDRRDNDGNYDLGNCRWATDQTQARNRGGKNGGARGVSWMKIQKKWRATICVGKDRHHLGVFLDKAGAIEARRKAEAVYWSDQL